MASFFCMIFRFTLIISILFNTDFHILGFDFVPNNSGFLDEHIAKVPSETGGTAATYICLVCEKRHNQRAHAQNHVESVHFPNRFVYTCRRVILSNL